MKLKLTFSEGHSRIVEVEVGGKVYWDESEGTVVRTEVVDECPSLKSRHLSPLN